ncbi:UNVERIFIED_CONTAM: hypothetical protein HDU68_008770 [Siphonaria sp. JEL0065]|nr:hypothetical protein HDU68_008770 [Siphonaria sp. JEL0065]
MSTQPPASEGTSSSPKSEIHSQLRPRLSQSSKSSSSNQDKESTTSPLPLLRKAGTRPVSAIFTGLLEKISLAPSPRSPRTSQTRKSTNDRNQQQQRNETTASIAAALFGDANTPMVELEEMTEKQQMKTFMVGKENTALRLYAAVTEEKMKVFLQVSRAKVFEVDLSNWEEQGTITINDLRDDYKNTEITNIERDPCLPNVYSVWAHTQMMSNPAPQGAIIVESDFKVVIHSEHNGVRSEKPIFSITGEFKLGRFMIIGRDESRRQKDVGNSSGWVAARDGVNECNFEIEEQVFYDQYEMAEANMSGPILIRRSPLLMAGVVVALASNKSANSN